MREDELELWLWREAGRYEAAAPMCERRELVFGAIAALAAAAHEARCGFGLDDVRDVIADRTTRLAKRIVELSQPLEIEITTGAAP